MLLDCSRYVPSSWSNTRITMRAELLRRRASSAIEMFVMSSSVRARMAVARSTPASSRRLSSRASPRMIRHEPSSPRPSRSPITRDNRHVISKAQEENRNAVA